MNNQIVQFQESLIQRQAETDEQLIKMWLFGKSSHTQRAYQTDIKRFFTFTGKTLHQVKIVDLQAFMESLDHLAPSSQQRPLRSIKSLMSFAHKIGYLPFDVGRVVKVKAVRDTLNERILDEEQILTMIALETNPRNRTLLKLLYSTGLRVSEVVQLKWKDLSAKDSSGVLTVYGKGNKTRHILLTPGIWKDLEELKGESGDDSPIFASRKGQGHLDQSAVNRIVKKAGKRAGIEHVSPHYLRHSHCTHAIERGAPISLVMGTLGHGSLEVTSRYVHVRPSDSSCRYLAV